MSKDAKLHKKFIQGEISAKDAIRQALAHGISAGRADMKAEIKAIVTDCQISGSEMADANEIITHIERTET